MSFASTWTNVSVRLLPIGKRAYRRREREDVLLAAVAGQRLADRLLGRPAAPATRARTTRRPAAPATSAGHAVRHAPSRDARLQARLRRRLAQAAKQTAAKRPERHVPGVAGVDRRRREAALFQCRVGRKPGGPGALHRHGPHAAALEPVGHAAQAGGGANAKSMACMAMARTGREICQPGRVA